MLSLQTWAVAPTHVLSVCVTLPVHTHPVSNTEGTHRITAGLNLQSRKIFWFKNTTRKLQNQNRYYILDKKYFFLHLNMSEIGWWLIVFLFCFVLEKIRYLSVNRSISLIITFTNHKNVIFENNFYFRSLHFMRNPK